MVPNENLPFAKLSHAEYSFHTRNPSIAQLVERSSYTRMVPGSNPGGWTNLLLRELIS